MGRVSGSFSRAAGMALAAGMLAVLVGACSGGGDTESGAAGQGALPTRADGDAATDSGSGMAANRAAGAEGTEARAQDGRGGAAELSTAQLAGDRKLARSARMTLRTGDVDTATAEARRIATDAGGYVASERSRRNSANLTLTVPGEELDVVLDKLTDLGDPTGRQITVEDLTDQIVDVDSRVESQRESVRRVRELLEQAKSISDLVTIERELAQREADLESLLARQDTLHGRVAMAPISLRLHEKPLGDEDDDGFLGGFASGWGAFTALLGAAAVALGAALPFLVLAGALAAIALALRRWRHRARTSATPPAGGAGSEAASGTA